jgi:hypothetical protein
MILEVMCGASLRKSRDMLEAAKMTDRDCTRACVKAVENMVWFRRGRLSTRTCPHSKKKLANLCNCIAPDRVDSAREVNRTH